MVSALLIGRCNDHPGDSNRILHLCKRRTDGRAQAEALKFCGYSHRRHLGAPSDCILSSLQVYPPRYNVVLYVYIITCILMCAAPCASYGIPSPRLAGMLVCADASGAQARAHHADALLLESRWCHCNMPTGRFAPHPLYERLRGGLGFVRSHPGIPIAGLPAADGVPGRVAYAVGATPGEHRVPVTLPRQRMERDEPAGRIWGARADLMTD